jgi:calcineurin-like phosphoesterase
MSAAELKKYRVLVREVWIQEFEVEATSEVDAKDRVVDGRATIVDGSLEFSHSLDQETWTVEEE